MGELDIDPTTTLCLPSQSASPQQLQIFSLEPVQSCVAQETTDLVETVLDEQRELDPNQ